MADVDDTTYSFTTTLWIWDARKSDSWTFATVPPEHSDDLSARSGPRAGFGSLPVEVTIGGSTWRTSVFPDKDSGCFVLPIKAAVRKAESVSAGDEVTITLRAVRPSFAVQSASSSRSGSTLPPCRRRSRRPGVR